ncbi:unnamed protein product [Urochloa humidicola]
MATLAPPPPSPLPLHPLDATPNPTSPMPALIPSLAATSPTSLPASSPIPATASGRSKAQRWNPETPPFGKFGDGASPLFYKEVLLAALPTAPVGAPPVPSVSPPCNATPRILLRPAARWASPIFCKY